MKRIQDACLFQTIRFEPIEEYEAYRSDLDKHKIKYVIDQEAVQADGSTIIKIRRQYCQYDLGNYLK